MVTDAAVANHASALKRHRQTRKRTVRNQALRTRLRHAIRAVRQAVRLGMPSWLVRRLDGSRSAPQLERALEALRDLDLALKTSRPPAASFEAALLRIAGPATPRRP